MKRNIFVFVLIIILSLILIGTGKSKDDDITLRDLEKKIDKLTVRISDLEERIVKLGNPRPKMMPLNNK